MRLSLPLVFAAASLLCVNLTARADVVYSLVDVAPSEFTGTHFTISSPNYLSVGQVYGGASGELFYNGDDEGPITDVGFSAIPQIFAITASADFAVFFGSFNLAQDGVYTDGYGDTFTVSGSPAVPPPVAVTPEPSSLALLGTGILGVIGVARKRFA